MVRTKAGGNKATGAKALRKVSVARPPLSTPTAKGKSRPGSNGNTYNPQSTPDWQKSINSFFSASQKSVRDKEAGCSSKSSDSMIEDCDDESLQHNNGESCTSNGHENGSGDIVAKDIGNGHTRQEERRSSLASNEEAKIEEKKLEDEQMPETVDDGDVEKDADEMEGTGDELQDEVMATNPSNIDSVERKGTGDSHVDGDDTGDSHIQGDDIADDHIDSEIMKNPANASSAVVDEPGGSGFVSNGLISDDDDD